MSQKASERESVRGGPRRGQLEARGRAGAHQGARRPDGLLDQPARDSDEPQDRARHQGRGDAEGREPGHCRPHQSVSARRANAGRRTWASSMNRCACSLATCCSPPPSSRTLRPSRVLSATPLWTRSRGLQRFEEPRQQVRDHVLRVRPAALEADALRLGSSCHVGRAAHCGVA